MSERLSLDAFSLGRTNVPLSLHLSLPTGTDGLQLPSHTYDAVSTTEVMRQMMCEVSEKIVANPAQDDEADLSQMTISVSFKTSGISLRPALSLRRTETLFSSSSEEDEDSESHTLSPVTSLSSDDGFDYDRAMSFAKSRAASIGMGVAMRNLNATLQADDPSAEERLSTVASKVIASLSHSPPALERHFSHSSVASDSDDENDLTDTERQERDMVIEYIKRWASNNRLDSTYWQGFFPLHLNVAVPLAQELTVYLAEQIIRDVSAQLNLPPPLEYERSRPRLTSDPTHVNSVGLADHGCLIRRAIPAGYVPQQILEKIRAAFNEECKANERRQVQTVTNRLQAGAKRAAGTYKEATTRRDPWTRSASTLRADVTRSMLTHDEATCATY